MELRPCALEGLVAGVLLQSLRFITAHPLNRGHRLRTLGDYLRWQVAFRSAGGAVVCPWVDDSVLLVARGMHGATGNVYCGLHELPGMGFAVHFLRAGDLFLDVGANVGTYTVLASRVCGARTIAIEPIAETLGDLERNVALNGIGDLVELHLVGVSDRPGRLSFSLEEGPMNHVVVDAGGETRTVEVETLDRILNGRSPVFVKIDVEGWEAQVLAGAQSLLDSAGLAAVLVEVSQAQGCVSPADSSVVQGLLGRGFTAVEYNPLTRALTPVSAAQSRFGNLLFVRDLVVCLAFD